MAVESGAATSQQQVPVLSRVMRKRQQKIRDILDATAEVLNTSGFHNLSMDDVASKLDLTKATLYHYFSSKHELVAACLGAVGDDVNARLRVIAESPEYTTSSERLRALLFDQLMAILTDFPEASQLFVRQQDWPSELSDLVRRLRKTHDDIFKVVIEEGVRSGEFADVNVTIVRHCLHGAINYAPVWTKGLSKETRTQKARSVVDHLMRMLEREPSKTQA